MGILDDAIREHLELKRQHGAASDDLERLEKEAFGPAARPGDPEFDTSEERRRGRSAARSEADDPRGEREPPRADSARIRARTLSEAPGDLRRRGRAGDQGGGLARLARGRGRGPGGPSRPAAPARRARAGAREHGAAGGARPECRRRARPTKSAPGRARPPRASRPRRHDPARRRARAREQGSADGRGGAPPARLAAAGAARVGDLRGRRGLRRPRPRARHRRGRGGVRLDGRRAAAAPRAAPSSREPASPRPSRPVRATSSRPTTRRRTSSRTRTRTCSRRPPTSFRTRPRATPLVRAGRAQGLRLRRRWADADPAMTRGRRRAST